MATLGASGPRPTEACGESVITLTRALALENARFGVTVNRVAPGVTMTAVPRDVEETVVTLIPMGRMGDPREVAAAQAFVDGGMSVGR